MAETPSGVAWTPTGVTQGTGKVIEGWVITPPVLSLPYVMHCMEPSSLSIDSQIQAHQENH